MLTEEQNRYVSDQVYLLDSSRADKDKRLIENKILSFEDKKPYLGSFQVLKVECKRWRWLPLGLMDNQIILK